MRAFKILVPLTLVFGMISCEGEKGDTGPQGAAGNANVDVFEYTIQTDQWQENDVAIGELGYGYYAFFSCPIISADIMNNGGLVQVYIAGSTNWRPLPWTAPVGIDQSGNGWQSNFTYTYELNTMIIETWDDDGLTVSPSSPLTVRVVTATSNKVSQAEIERLLELDIADIEALD